MSYSYIKSVFPNFKAPVYEYPEAKIPVRKPEPAISPLMAYNDQELAQFVKNLLQKTESVPVVSVQASEPPAQVMKSVNNRVFTQPPIPEQYLKNTQGIQKVFTNPFPYNNGSVESFGNEMSSDCESYIYHTMNCAKCRHALMRQLGKDKGKIDLVEILTYLLFGILVLMVIDHFRGRR